MTHTPKPQRRPSPRPPSRVPVRGEMTVEQQTRLAKHLASEIPITEAARVFYAIEHWWFYGPHSATHQARERHEVNRMRSSRIAHLARALREELYAESEHEHIVTQGVDVDALGAVLERIVEVSARLAPAPVLKRRRGPPVLEWRDDLIALVHAHYPQGLASKTRFGNFESTVELVLGYLGEELEDLHTQIVRTLARRPSAPFILQIDDPSTEPRRHLPWSSGHLRMVRET